MIILSSIQIRRGAHLLIDGATVTINSHKKVGLVGKNGSGKSTLFALLKNEIIVDSGHCSLPKHWALASVNQETLALNIPALEYVINGDHEYRQIEQQLATASEQNDGNTIALLHNKLDTIQAWGIQARASTLLYGLGFSQQQLQQPVKMFSGGWRMRLNLAQALICRSDLLLLDEPTNHLDLDAIIWLEKWLKNYSGTLILISHDRDFLDPIVDKILHIEQQKINEYTGNYSSFEQQRAAKLQQQQALYQNQQTRVVHLQSYIDRFQAQATKARQAQSRIKMLKRMVLVSPSYSDNPFHFRFKTPERLPTPLLQMDGITAGYGKQTILSAIKLNLVPGSRIGLLGRNGVGKSTLMKLLAGILPPKTGNIILTKGIKLGYFAQHQLETLRTNESPLQHLSRLAQKENEQQLRDYLGNFGFHGDKSTSIIGRFSGGEKARLVLALIAWQRPNLLLLDEPTNHLDLDMRQALIEALIDFDGALVVVSHDRHLLRATTDELYLVHNNSVEPFDGDLDNYQQWLIKLQKQNTLPNNLETKLNINDAQHRKIQRRHEAEFRGKIQPLRKQLIQIEEKIEQLAIQSNEVKEALLDNSIYSNSRKTELNKLLQKQGIIQSELKNTEINWLDIQEQLETLTKTFRQNNIY